jgi:hypothetical protein
MWDVFYGGLRIYAPRYLNCCEMMILDRSALVASPHAVCKILTKLTASDQHAAEQSLGTFICVGVFNLGLHKKV